MDPSTSLRMTAQRETREKQSALYRYSPIHAHRLYRRPRFVILSAAKDLFAVEAACPLPPPPNVPRPPTTDYRPLPPVILSAAEGSIRTSYKHAR